MCECVCLSPPALVIRGLGVGVGLELEDDGRRVEHSPHRLDLICIGGRQWRLEHAQCGAEPSSSAKEDGLGATCPPPNPALFDWSVRTSSALMCVCPVDTT